VKSGEKRENEKYTFRKILYCDEPEDVLEKKDLREKRELVGWDEHNGVVYLGS
jgi:hypothetical protein